MQILLSHFNAEQFVVQGCFLVNATNNIVITVMMEDESFALYQNNAFVEVESKSGLEELVNQVIKSFIETCVNFKST